MLKNGFLLGEFGHRPIFTIGAICLLLQVRCIAGGLLVVHLPVGILLHLCVGVFVIVPSHGCLCCMVLFSCFFWLSLFSLLLIFLDAHRIPHLGAAELPKFLPHGILILLLAEHPQGDRPLPRHLGKVRRGIPHGGDGLPDRREGGPPIEEGRFDLMDQQRHPRVVLGRYVQIDVAADGGAGAEQPILLPRILVVSQSRLPGRHALFARDDSAAEATRPALLLHLSLPLPRLVRFEQEAAQVVLMRRVGRILGRNVRLVVVGEIVLPIEFVVALVLAWLEGGDCISVVVVVKVAATSSRSAAAAPLLRSEEGIVLGIPPARHGRFHVPRR